MWSRNPQQIDMNLLSCVLCCRAARQCDDGGNGGRIVNIAARPGIEPRLGAGMAAYAASKAAVAALTQEFAAEVAGAAASWSTPWRPRSWTRPPTARAMPKADYALWPKVEEVAATILFLAGQPRDARRHRAGVREGVVFLSLPPRGEG